MTINWKLLHLDINAQLDQRSFRDLATEWEIPPSTFTRLSQGKAIRAETLLFILGKIDHRPERYVSKKKR